MTKLYNLLLLHSSSRYSASFVKFLILKSASVIFREISISQSSSILSTRPTISSSSSGSRKRSGYRSHSSFLKYFNSSSASFFRQLVRACDIARMLVKGTYWEYYCFGWMITGCTLNTNSTVIAGCLFSFGSTSNSGFTKAGTGCCFTPSSFLLFFFVLNLKRNTFL